MGRLYFRYYTRRDASRFHRDSSLVKPSLFLSIKNNCLTKKSKLAALALTP